MGDLRELIERLETEGPSYALDVAIATALVPQISVLRQRDDDSGADPHTYRCFTTKVDDALWLATLLLDNGFVDIEVAYRSGGGRTYGRAEICGPHVDSAATGATPAIALLLATLRALSDQDTGQGEESGR